VPTGFAIQAPARIALDIPGATNAMGRSAVDLNVGNLRSVNVVQAPDRARLVLNLKTPASYRTQIDGKSLIVTLDPVAQAGTTVAAPQTFAESRNRDTQPIRDLDFRPRPGRLRPRDSGPAQQPGRRGHPPAGPVAGGSNS
jgi:type IV pilus assembly protein PilQ